MLTNTLKAIVLGGLLWGLSGCSSWVGSNFVAPRVELANVEVIRARLLEQEFMLRFRIHNPNDYSLPVRGLKYRVKLNELQLAEGETSQWLSIPAGATEYYDVPVHTNLWRRMKYVVRLLEKPDRPINYQLQGELRTGMVSTRETPIFTSGSMTPLDFIPEL